MSELERWANEEANKFFDQRTPIDTESRKRIWLQGVEFFRERAIRSLRMELNEFMDDREVWVIEQAIKILKKIGD